MGQQVDLLRSLPRISRDVRGRHFAKSPEVIRVAKQFGPEYFDGDRKYGYGGYLYDGRWRTVVWDMILQYGLRSGARVLDVGCAKGFLVYDMARFGLDAYGLDVSPYAVVECPHPGVVGRLHLGTASELPFLDQSFDLVVSINTLHNLERARLIRALREIKRVSRGSMFVQVDSYRTAAEREEFLSWVLTAEFHGYPEDWLAVFEEAGYGGDYGFTVVEE